MRRAAKVVNQKQFKVTVTKAIVSKLRSLLMMATYLGIPTMQIRLYRELKSALNDLELIIARSKEIYVATFNLNALSYEQCLTLFRFKKSEVPVVMNLMGWTTGVTRRNKYACYPIEATCILIRRQSYPCRWVGLENFFGMHSSALCEVFYECAWQLYEKRGNLVTTYRADLMVERALMYASAVYNHSNCLDKSVAFIDQTKIKICRPGGRSAKQRSVYSGNMRIHCLVYQTLSTPHGLIFSYLGPAEGKHSDRYMNRASDVEKWLRETHCIDGVQYYIYGDQAYTSKSWIQTAYPMGIAAPEQIEFNDKMNAARIAVEWSYKDVKQSFPSYEFSRKLQVRNGPVGLFYAVSVLLRNFKICLGHSAQSSCYFDYPARSLERYLNMHEN